MSDGEVASVLRQAVRHGDVAMVAAVFGVLMVLFAPIPAGLLDFLILGNLNFALLILLLTFYAGRPVDFSTFPSLLLIATLFRLALNVAATRLVLSDANAGKVIAAVGAFVVGGNYVIGFVVFLILIVVQYVVVTSGAQRVSEVAARFTLDSMPGQQMSIDADLNMGFIDQTEAQRRRKNLEREAAFYGAMDGASKFVKGDAVAGIVIVLINIIGGLVIGVMQHGLSWAQALQTYTLLTIGDGIVTQVPALVIAVGTGIIVTRSASDTNLSLEVLRQVTASPKALMLVGVALFGLLLLPGVPVVPTLVLECSLLLAATLAFRHAGEGRTSAHATSGTGALAAPPNHPKASDQEAVQLLAVEPVEVRVGSRLAAAANGAGIGLVERVTAFRSSFAQEFGMILPNVRFRDDARLGPDRYEIVLDGVPAARGEARFDKLLAIHPNGDVKTIPGEATREPTYGLPAIWIDESQRGVAAAAKFTLVDAPVVLITHLTEVLRREAASLLTRSETDKLLARVRNAQPTLVEELIPAVLTMTDVQRVLQNLLREKVSIRNLEAILETLADGGRHTKDSAQLTELVRQRLGRAVCQGLLGDASSLQVLTLDPAVEGELLRRIQEARGPDGARQQAVFEPSMVDRLVARLVQQSERMMKSNLLPVLLCAPELRRQLRAMVERAMPHLRVLSVSEVPQNVELQSWGVVSL